MAVEWIGLGVAVAKVLLRAADHGSVADWMGDGSDLVSRLRGLRGHPDDVGQQIARTLQRELTPNLSSEDQGEISGAAAEVIQLMTELVGSDKAILHAATHPETFLEYARRRGQSARRQVSLGAESVFDRILDEACKQFVSLAPWYPGFDRAAFTKVFGQLGYLIELNQETVGNTRETLRNTRLLLERQLEPDIVQASLNATTEGVKLGKPVRDWAAASLRVHDTIRVGDATGLTAYIPRPHDTKLREMLSTVDRARLVVVVGTSCSGKTRTCLEAVRETVPDWTVVRPLDVEDLTRLLREGIPGKTVVWLDELQNFLTTDGVSAARGIRQLLDDETHTPPILFLGTIWPTNLTAIEARPDPAQATDGRGDISTLLTDNRDDRVHVPDSFSDQELQVGSNDLRMQAAIRHAVDGQITQVLAGGTQLVERTYGDPTAPDAYSPAQRAVLLAVADLRRIGHPDPLPHWAILSAAPDYLDPDQTRWHPSGWPSIALNDLLDQARTQHEGQRDLHHRGVPAIRPSASGLQVEFHDFFSSTI